MPFLLLALPFITFLLGYVQKLNFEKVFYVFRLNFLNFFSPFLFLLFLFFHGSDCPAAELASSSVMSEKASLRQIIFYHGIA